MKFYIESARCVKKGRITIKVQRDRIEFSVVEQYYLSSPKSLAAALLLCDEIKRRLTQKHHGLYSVSLDTRPDHNILESVPKTLYRQGATEIFSTHYIINGYGRHQVSEEKSICAYTTVDKKLVYKIYNMSTSDAEALCKMMYPGEDISKIPKDKLREDLGTNHIITTPI